jgi:hypothetical protein
MKNLKYIIFASFFGILGCTEELDIENYDNIVVPQFYQNETELNIALNGAYSQMRAPLSDEWGLTEVKSDNAFMNISSTSSVTNLDIKDLDVFNPASNQARIYNYWYSTYKNIRSVNFLQENLKVNYNPENGTLTYDAFTLPVADNKRKQISAQASFIRAYHYFNLVRIFGDVFLVHKTISPNDARFVNRAPTADIYKLIIADLKNAIDNGISTTYSATPNATTDVQKGIATTWAAKALLAKVYLTLNLKDLALPLLNDVQTLSGYSLVTSSYANVFAATNEMNSEIIFAIRFKAGGIGQGSPLANIFAPASNYTIVGNGLGYNSITPEYFNSFATNDTRKAVNAIFQAGIRYYSSKHLTAVTLANDSEKDWPVIRYADILLMKAEALGNVPESRTLINLVHQRSVPTAISAGEVDTTAKFEKVLADERRWEFGQENQRWFDLLRFNTTLTTINTKTVMDAHFDAMSTVYAAYAVQTGVPDLSVIKSNVNPNRFLSPIPQYEIDTNTTISILQNPGY